MVVQLDQQGSNKIQLLEYAPAAPNKCASCGWSATQNGRYYIDMQLDLEFYGVVYLCSSCFSETAKVLGLTDPGETAEELAAVKNENAVLRQIVEDLNGIVPDLDVAIRAIRRFISNGPDSSSVTEPLVLESPGKPGQPNFNSTKGIGTPAKLINGGGSTDVLSNADDGVTGTIEL